MQRPDGPDELRTWKVTFARLAHQARAAGRRAACDAITDEIDPLAIHMPTADRNRREAELLRLVEQVQGEAFTESVAEAVAAVPTWEFTKHLVRDPLLPAALDRIRREYADGFFETLDLSLLPTFGGA